MTRRIEPRLWLCLAASLALHLLLLSLLPERLSSNPPPSVVTARLVPIEPAPPPPAPKPAPATRPKPAAAQKVLPTPVSPPPRTVDTPAVATPWTDESESTAEPTPAPEPTAALPAPEPSASAPAPAPPSRKAALTDPVRELPRAGSIRYELSHGTEGFRIGRTVQTWQIGQRTYQLTSFSETTGLASVFRPYQLGYVTRGRVDESGFRPESLSVNRGRDGAPQYFAQFDWSAQQLALGPPDAPRRVDLVAGTVDVLTLAYQLARMALLPGRVELYVTNGNKLGAYQLDIGEEQLIDLPLGRIRAIPVRQVRVPGEESLEIWLAPDRRHLPVRVRFFDRNGALSGEQVATEILVDAN